MTNILDFLANPEAAMIFVEEFKAGKIGINWKEVIADEDKFENLQELAFGLILQAADNASAFNANELNPLAGKILILNRQMENALAEGKTTELTALSKQFEVAVREFASIIDVKAAVASLTALESQSEDALADIDFDAACPLFTLIIRLRMLVNAHEITDLEHDEEEMMFECEEDDQCEEMN